MRNRKPIPLRRAWSTYACCQVPTACTGVPPPHQVLELQPSREEELSQIFLEEEQDISRQLLEMDTPSTFCVVVLVFFFPPAEILKKRGFYLRPE